MDTKLIKSAWVEGGKEQLSNWQGIVKSMKEAQKYATGKGLSTYEELQAPRIARMKQELGFGAPLIKGITIPEKASHEANKGKITIEVKAAHGTSAKVTGQRLGENFKTTSAFGGAYGL